ncbi:MAG: glycosyltransferase family 4 protein [Steroidobacteraceae bacterium]
MEQTFLIPQETLDRLRRPRIRPLKLYFAGGTGNILATFRSYLNEQHDPSIVAIAYSHMFFDVCKALGAKALAESNFDSFDRECRDGITVGSRPRYKWGARGIFYHLSHLCYTLSIVFTALRFRADVFICATDVVYPALIILRWFGVPVIISLHTTLWPRNTIPKPVRQLQNKMDGWAWRHAIDATLCVSPEIKRQLETISNGHPKGPIIWQVPQYRNDTFTPKPSPDDSVFHVTFCGRVERNKGIFLLIEAAVELQHKLPDRIRWHICGDGSASEELSNLVKKIGVDKIVTIHGQLNQPRLVEQIFRSHVLVSPTTTGFPEGLAKVPVEAALAARPSIVSSAVPAAEVLGDAVIEIPADDTLSIVEAVEKLATDPITYQRHRDACTKEIAKFYDRSRSWGSVLLLLLDHILNSKK